MTKTYQFLIIIFFLFNLSSSFSQITKNNLNYVKPTIENQKYNHIFVSFKRSQFTIFNKNKQHLTGEFVGMSDSLVFMKFENDSLLHAFEIKELSRVRYKRGSGYIGGAIIGLVTSTALSSLVLLEKNDGWQVLGFVILMGTIVPANTFIGGGGFAIFSEKINIKTSSKRKAKKIKTLQKFAKIKNENLKNFNYINSDFFLINKKNK